MLQEKITRATAWRLYKSRLPMLLVTLGLGVLYIIVYNIITEIPLDILLIALSLTIPLSIIAAYVGARIGASRMTNIIYTLTDKELCWEKMDRKEVIELNAIKTVKDKRSGLMVKADNKKIFIPSQLEKYEQFKTQLAQMSHLFH